MNLYRKHRTWNIAVMVLEVVVSLVIAALIGYCIVVGISMLELAFLAVAW